MRWVSRSSSGLRMGRYRCVPRGWLRMRQARQEAFAGLSKPCEPSSLQSQAPRTGQSALGPKQRRQQSSQRTQRYYGTRRHRFWGLVWHQLRRVTPKKNASRSCRASSVRRTTPHVLPLSRSPRNELTAGKTARAADASRSGTTAHARMTG